MAAYTFKIILIFFRHIRWEVVGQVDIGIGGVLLHPVKQHAHVCAGHGMLRDTDEWFCHTDGYSRGNSRSFHTGESMPGLFDVDLPLL
jgi:hypothetical protein